METSLISDLPPIVTVIKTLWTSAVDGHGYEFHAPAALNRAGTERRLDGHDVVGRGGKEKRSRSC